MDYSVVGEEKIGEDCGSKERIAGGWDILWGIGEKTVGRWQGAVEVWEIIVDDGR